MEFLCIGLNHTTAPLAVRERVAFAESEIEKTLGIFKKEFAPADRGGLTELMILSTCNRTEFYCVAQDIACLKEELTSEIADYKSIARRDLQAHTYVYSGLEAARHLYRVVCGIDSMVLGETQIVGQFKKAVGHAQKAATTGLMLHHLFQTAYTVAKLVRSKTSIGSNSVSLAAAAVRLVQQVYEDISQCHVLYIGAGEMIELCAAHFSTKMPKSITVANRSVDRGAALASRYHGKSIRLQDLPSMISHYDVVVTCTASILPIIGLGMVERALQERNGRPMCIVDLAVPRDAEPEIARLEHAYVYSMDELGAAVQSGRESRIASVEKGEILIANEVETLSKWLIMRSMVPAITRMHQRAQRMREQSLKEALKGLRSGKNPEEVLEKFSKRLTNRLLHSPTILLRNAGKLGETAQEKMVATVGTFYKLHGH